MSMSAGGSKKGAQSDINVTPLVDVCLVLLIIFMVMLPKNVPELSVKVPPESKTRQKPQPESENLVIGLTKDGAITLNRTPVEKSNLKDTLENQLKFRDKKVIFVNFDDDAVYGVAVEVLDIAKHSGADVLGIMKNKDKPTPDTLRQKT
ncbi:ExbD/TolR family protein [Nannocystis punicea]|uniref:Biopolymer transporter ExbD n=1 Tax=Nannocystis punicea TaxID=2995304 RepID=A0ABY7HKB7_9BACT|nr:biopolymer transporter ExbD [Nannocystis poenicansa]WAS99482.1 biopolymer transporter ExbD [Nannocystis poenicansa]